MKDDYKIIKITNFEEANQYKDYTTWCTSHHLDDYKAYVFPEDQLYIIEKDGFDNLYEKKTKGFPLDEYGLSLMMVIIEEDGNLKYASSRWNDIAQFLNADNISDILDVDFNETFKPKISNN